MLLNRLLARTRLRQLQLLVLIADFGSIQRAADAAGQTQPSATKALAELERLVGLSLFERHARGVRPTLVCRDLLPRLRSMLGSLSGCAEMLAAAAEGAQGVVTVGAITGAVSGLLGRALPDFLDRHAKLRVEVVEDSHHALLSGLAMQTLDMVLVREPATLASGTRFTPLLEDRVVAVAAPGHPLLRRREVHAEQLLEQLWILAPLATQMHDAFECLFKSCGQLPKRTPLVTRSLPMLLEFLRARPALALTPLSLVQPFVETGWLQVLKLQCPDALPPIGMLVHDVPEKQGVVLLGEYLVHAQCAVAPPSIK
ncbi:LysR family transcriptional regulator [Comamonas humi]